MRNAILSLAGLLCALPMPAALAEAPDTTTACENQLARCSDQCDGQKTLWFFKGEAYDNCIAKCETQRKLCLAEDLDVDRFEVIVPRGEKVAREKKPENETASESQ